MDEINNLVLSGGAVNGFYTLGVLDVLSRMGKLNNLKSITGVSIGAFIGVLMSLGLSARDIADRISEISSKGPNWGYAHLITLLPMYLRTGFLMDSKLYEEYLDDLLKEYDINTMKELYNKTNKNVTIVVSNLTDFKVEYINYTDYPDMLVKDALLMSMCLPFCFEPRIFKEKTYCDGALFDSFPLQLHPCENTLGVYLLDQESPIMFKQIMVGIMRQSYNKTKLLCKDHKVIEIYKTVPDIFMQANIQEQLSMYTSGQNQSTKQIIELFGEVKE